jgi:uncharacterized DUF497 family protein
VLDRIEGFDWDNANVGHILRHAVTPFEVFSSRVVTSPVCGCPANAAAEEVTGGKFMVIPARTIERGKRWKLFGKTTSGRHLVVMFTIRRKMSRTVTAYRMNAAEWSRYAPQID